MEIPDNLLCLFSGEVEEVDGRYVIEVSAREVTEGRIQSDQKYRAALVQTEASKSDEQSQTAKPKERTQKENQLDTGPPVEEGEQRTVDIEDIGEQGDGVARVERGYVVIVPDTEMNERVTIEIEDVNENVGFGEVIKRHDYYE